MANYPYEMQLVVDPDNPRNIVAAGSVSIYDSADTGKTTLLPLTDPNGVPIPNPISSNANGFTPPFVTTSPQVLWVSGEYVDYFNSYIGMRDEAIAAKTAAENAAAVAGANAAAVATAAIGTATDEAAAAAASAAIAASNASASAAAAANSAALVGAPADTAIAAAINGTGATKTALNATYATTAAVAAKADVTAVNAKLDKAAKASRVFTLAGLGDSITDGTANNNDADRYTDTTWLHLTHALSMGKIVPGGNFGVGGNRIDQMLTRIPDVIASGATACLILGGTNDVAQLATEAEVLTNVDRLFNEGHDVLAAAGVQPICATIPPRGRSTAPSTDEHKRRISKANARIRRYAQQRGYPLVDFHKILVDPATGMFLDIANNTSDAGVHPNTVYCRKMAEAVVAAVSPMAGAFVADLAGWQTDPTNLIPNGLFLGTTSTINSYPMPQGWNGGVNNQRAVTAPAAVDNLLGNWFELYKDATQAAATGGDTTALNPTIAAGPTTFEVGDRLRFTCRARISDFEGGVASNVGTRLITLNMNLAGVNTNRSPLWQWTCNIADAVPSIEFVVPAGATALSLQASIYGQGRLAIGQVTLRNLTKLGLT